MVTYGHWVSAVPGAAVHVGRPFQNGYDERRLLGPRISPEERKFRDFIEAKLLPQAGNLLAAMLAAGMNGDVKAAELFFKVCGLIRKPTDDAAIQETAKALLDGMIAEARSRRAGP